LQLPTGIGDRLNRKVLIAVREVIDRSEDRVSKRKLRFHVRSRPQRGDRVFGNVPGKYYVRVGRLDVGRLSKVAEARQRALDPPSNRRFV
jgi:hypothetical protein